MTMNKHCKYVLIGGGLAASSAVQAIRELDAAGPMLLVGLESSRPYHRPPLSKQFLRGQTSRDELFTTGPEWFAQHDVELHTAMRCVQLDTYRRTVVLDNGQEVSFDALLIATGALARRLTVSGAHLPNVYYLRTVDDAQRLQHAAQQARLDGRRYDGGARGQAVVVGGGVLGVELAASLTQMGLCVHLLYAPQLWNRFAGEATAKCLEAYLEHRGVQLHVGTRPDRLEGDGRVQRVVTTAGQIIDCDLVVAAVGMAVNRELLRGTSIAAEKAILVDDHCRTNIEQIYAAGDCAAVYDPLFGKHRVLDHWDNAQVTGRLAGRNMAGADEAYHAVNYFFSDVFELSMSAWGESRLVERRIMRGTPNVQSPDLIEIGVGSDGRVAQVVALGHGGEDQVLSDLVRQRVQVDGRENAIRDPRFDLAELLGRAGS